MALPRSPAEWGSTDSASVDFLSEELNRGKIGELRMSAKEKLQQITMTSKLDRKDLTAK